MKKFLIVVITSSLISACGSTTETTSTKAEETAATNKPTCVKPLTTGSRLQKRNCKKAGGN